MPIDIRQGSSPASSAAAQRRNRPTGTVLISVRSRRHAEAAASALRERRSRRCYRYADESCGARGPAERSCSRRKSQ